MTMVNSYGGCSESSHVSSIPHTAPAMYVLSVCQRAVSEFRRARVPSSPSSRPFHTYQVPGSALSMSGVYRKAWRWEPLTQSRS